MYQYQQPIDSSSLGEPSTTTTPPNKAVKKKHLSAPPSADVSPYMSEKECMEQPESEDPESPGSNNFNSKSRRASLNKAERRAEHNAIERARRECLNSKFQQLAEVLPNLQNHRRPSKGQIVEKALDWVKQNISKEDRYQYQIMQLQNENKRLMAQVNIVHEQHTTHKNSKSGIVTPPIHTSSPSFPVTTTSFHRQQFPAISTPTTIDSIQKSNTGAKMNHFCEQQEEINMMYSMVPLGVEWQHQQQHFVNENNLECMMPSITLATTIAKPLLDDDNDSSSSADEAQKQHHIQMSIGDISHSSFFEVNHQQQQQPPIAPWCKINQQPSYSMNYVPPNSSINYGHYHSYMS